MGGTLFINIASAQLQKMNLQLKIRWKVLSEVNGFANGGTDRMNPSSADEGVNGDIGIIV